MSPPTGQPRRTSESKDAQVWWAWKVKGFRCGCQYWTNGKRGSERAVDCLLAGCSSGNGRSARAKHAGPRMKLKLKYWPRAMEKSAFLCVGVQRSIRNVKLWKCSMESMDGKKLLGTYRKHRKKFIFLRTYEPSSHPKLETFSTNT